MDEFLFIEVTCNYLTNYYFMYDTLLINLDLQLTSGGSERYF